MTDGSIIHIIRDAGLMVKFILLLLCVMSVVTWAIVYTKFLLLRRTRQESNIFLETFWKSRTLADAYINTKNLKNSSIAEVFRVGYGELLKFGKPGSDPEVKNLEIKKISSGGNIACMENIERALCKAISNEVNRLSKVLSFLATTGSTAPFIGLFGTVWGIMSAFRSIGLRGSANLATVAPGISEALIATAAGLAAAIPAVIAFNYYVNIIRKIESDMQGFANDFSNLVEREYIHRPAGRSGAARGSKKED
ncbi:MAG: protein TolQ [Deltaproteobacteria bacterium]|nr:protein TolQ [Deltaproteobacteria bacterium]